MMPPPMNCDTKRTLTLPSFAKLYPNPLRALTCLCAYCTISPNVCNFSVDGPNDDAVWHGIINRGTGQPRVLHITSRAPAGVDEAPRQSSSNSR